MVIAKIAQTKKITLFCSSSRIICYHVKNYQS